MHCHSSCYAFLYQNQFLELEQFQASIALFTFARGFHREELTNHIQLMGLLSWALKHLESCKAAETIDNCASIYVYASPCFSQSMPMVHGALEMTTNESTST